MKLRTVLAMMILGLPGAKIGLGDEVTFNRDIRPLLSDRCFHCHGPSEEDRQAGLRLDRADGPEGSHEFVIEPGSADDSELWNRITSDDPGMVMPPPDSHKEPLSEEEKRLIGKWIEQGAPYQSFWAFVAPAMPELPADIEGSPIDRLVRDRLERERLDPSPPADQRTLIRRLSLDLTGLPPTRSEIKEFLDDDSPGAYERLVDRLLASPHYGEHMARYWLDLVRFADTNGIHHDHYRDLSPYRDWVIRAFNENLPYDDFVRFQLAGDLYPEPTTDQLIASGFHRLHLIIDVGTALPEESFNRNVLDRVTSMGTAFMGLTVQCAVCHDHKYDPLTMKEFYSLSAFFNNIDATPETGGRRGTDFLRGLQTPYINLTDDQQERQLERLETAITAAEEELAERRAELAARTTQKRPEESNTDASAKSADNREKKNAAEQAVKDAEQSLQSARQSRDDYLLTIPAAMVMKERDEERPAHVLVRGAYDNPGQQVPRATPAFLPPLQDDDGKVTRMDLANWFVRPEHPLTARVAVNRIWQQLFGVGIVRTAEDFGAQGEWPSHPDLLDYLAVRFVDNGWNVGELIKEIVMSNTYRQSSLASPEAYAADPDNRLLTRGSRYRLDSEVIRDQLLATSGLLNRKMYGKSVKPPQPDGLWTAVSMPSSYPRKFEPDSGEEIYRRSVYTFWKRGMPPPQMTILNAPSREECIARRERTNTPLQALLLLNEVEYLKAARHLAAKLLEKDGPNRSEAVDQEGGAKRTEGANRSERISILYETITSHVPSGDVHAAFDRLLADLQSTYQQSPELAAELCGDREPPAGVSVGQWAAWTVLASTVYNLDITKMRQ